MAINTLSNISLYKDWRNIPFIHSGDDYQTIDDRFSDTL